MLNEGDTVWYKVTDKKERLGKVIARSPISDGGAAYLVQTDNGEGVMMAHELRPASEYTKPKGTKHDDGKNRLELVPPSALEAMGRAFTYGSKKYADHNWANGFEWDRLVGALMRHLNAWRSGQDKDPESGLSHLDHVLACAAMLSAHEQEGLGNDNRRKTIS